MTNMESESQASLKFPESSAATGYTQFIDDTQIIYSNNRSQTQTQSPTLHSADDTKSQTAKGSTDILSSQESQPIKQTVSDTFDSNGTLSYQKETGNSPKSYPNNPIIKSFCQSDSISTNNQNFAADVAVVRNSPSNQNEHIEITIIDQTQADEDESVFKFPISAQKQTPFLEKIHDPFEDTPDNLSASKTPYFKKVKANFENSPMVIKKKATPHSIFQNLREEAGEMELHYGDEQIGLVIDRVDDTEYVSHSFRNDTMRIDEEEEDFPMSPKGIVHGSGELATILTQVMGTAEKESSTQVPNSQDSAHPRNVVYMTQEEINTDDDGEVDIDVEADNASNSNDTIIENSLAKHEDSLVQYQNKLKRKASDNSISQMYRASKMSTEGSNSKTAEISRRNFRSFRTFRSPTANSIAAFSSPNIVEESSPAIREAHVLKIGLRSPIKSKNYDNMPPSSPTGINVTQELTNSSDSTDNDEDDDDYKDDDTEEIEDPIQDDAEDIEPENKEDTSLVQSRPRRKNHILSDDSPGPNQVREASLEIGGPWKADSLKIDKSNEENRSTDEDNISDEGYANGTDEDVSTHSDKTQIIKTGRSSSPHIGSDSELAHMSSQISSQLHIDPAVRGKSTTDTLQIQDVPQNSSDDIDINMDMVSDIDDPITKKDKVMDICRNTGVLTSSDIKSINSVWARYNMNMYPGYVTDIDWEKRKAIVEFFDMPAEVPVSDLFLLDIKVADRFHRIKSKPMTWVVTGLTYKKRRSDDSSDIRCMRGYNCIYAKKLSRNKLVGEEQEFALKEIELTPSLWAIHQKKGFLQLDGKVYADMLQETILVENSYAKDTSILEPKLESTPIKRSPQITEHTAILRTSPRKSKKRVKGIFSGSIFCITNADEKQSNNVKVLTELIEKHDGVVLRDGLFDLKMVSKENGLCLESDMISGYDFVAIISNTFCRTIKYLQALALGWPVLSERFIFDSIEDPELLEEWTSYLLPAGHSHRIGTVKSHDISTFMRNNQDQLKLSHQLSNNTSILSKYKIIAVAPNSIVEPEVCEFIFHGLGARNLLKCISYKDAIAKASELTSLDDDFKLLLYDNDNVIENTLKSLNKARAAFLKENKRSATDNPRKSVTATIISRPATSTGFSKSSIQLHIINKEWVIQCVISGYAWKTEKVWTD